MIAGELRAPAPGELSAGGGEPSGSEALTAIPALLEGLFEAAPLGLGLLDRELRLIRVNARLARLAELTSLTPGRPVTEALPAFASPELLDEARRVLATGEPSRELELTLGEGPEGRRVFVEFCHAIQGAGGLLGLGLVVQDVTRRRRQEEFQERVVGIVGHDLRSPLAALRISAQILARGLADPRQGRLLNVIQGAAERMQRIIEDLLDYTRARVGAGIPVRPRATDVSQVCREVVGEALAADPARQARCEGEGDAVAELDPDRLGQALANVVGNAFRYGAPEQAVEVRWHGEPAEVVVEVTNQGPPIPPELIAEVFEPFRRGVHQTGEGGLGLGLFIARHIIEAHGGSLAVRSAEGETCFTVRLPRRRG